MQMVNQMFQAFLCGVRHKILLHGGGHKHYSASLTIKGEQLASQSHPVPELEETSFNLTGQFTQNFPQCTHGSGSIQDLWSSYNFW